jgi:hypothetical protein
MGDNTDAILLPEQDFPMAAYRLAALLLALPLLAACDSEQQPPEAAATPAAEAQPAAAPMAAEPVAVAAAEADTAPLFGTFARELNWCNGEGDGFPVTISATSFQGYENSCDITALTDNGDGSFGAELSCTGEGQTVEESLVLVPVFAPSGEGINITYVDRGNDRTTLLRCG